MKNTKKSLLVSVLSLMLCVAMLLGTTYAWFTDSVTSGVNQIVAGNLDVEVTHTNANVTAATDISGETNMFPDKDGNAIKWEPGAVSYENFTVSNVGDLALKYNMSLNITDFNNIAGTSLNLKQPLKVIVLTGDNILQNVTRETVAALNWANAQTLEDFKQEGKALYPNSTEGKASEEKFQVIVYWQPTDNDNQWNVNNGKTVDKKFENTDRLYIDFGLRLIATQLEHEYDSFDNQYDKNASFSEEVSTTVKEGEATVFTSAVTPSNESGKTTTVTVPANVADFTAGSATTMKIEATPTLAANHKFTISSDGAVGAIDLTVKVDNEVVSEFRDSNDQPVPVIVETYVAKNMTNVSLSYNNGAEKWTKVENESDVNAVGKLYYDKNTGRLLYMTTHFSTFVLGADEVAYVEETNMAYKTLKEAFPAANNTQTIYLLKDFTHNCASKCIDILPNTVRTLDINGKTITVTGATGAAANRLFDVFGTLNIVDTAATKGELKNNSKNGPFIVVNAGGTLSATGVKMSATEKRELIDTNGSSSPVNITLKDCTFIGRCYFPAGGTYTIDGGTYEGRLGTFYFKSGTINILGGRFSSDGADGDWGHCDSGCGFTGEGVVVEACNYPSGNPVVNITGGTFTGGSGGAAFKNYGLLIINYNGNTANMAGTTVDYRLATIDATNWHNVSGYIIPGTTLNAQGCYHFTDENTTLVTPGSN